MTTETRTYPVLGEIVILSAALVAMIRALEIPMTLLSALRSLVLLPMTALKLLSRALAIVLSLVSLVGNLFPILKATASLMVMAAIVARLQTLVNRLKL